MHRQAGRMSSSHTVEGSPGDDSSGGRHPGVLCLKIRLESSPRPTKLRSQRDINLWRIPLQLSLAATALFGSL